jgi:hypothetical protein
MEDKKINSDKPEYQIRYPKHFFAYKKGTECNKSKA